MITAQSDPWAHVIFPAIGLVILVWPKRHGEILKDARVSILRRIVAFYLDFIPVMLLVLPILILPALLLEYRATGEWRWSFSRNFSRPTDLILLVEGLLVPLAIVMNLRWHVVKGRQTWGQHLLGFKLYPAHETPSVTTRIFLAWLIAACWPFWPWTISGERLDYRWDTASGIKARRVAW